MSHLRLSSARSVFSFAIRVVDTFKIQLKISYGYV